MLISPGGEKGEGRTGRRAREKKGDTQGGIMERARETQGPDQGRGTPGREVTGPRGSLRPAQDQK